MVAIEKEAFEPPSTKVANFTDLLILKIFNERKWSRIKRGKKHDIPQNTIKDADYIDDLLLLKNTSVQAECLVNNPEQSAKESVSM